MRRVFEWLRKICSSIEKRLTHKSGYYVVCCLVAFPLIISAQPGNLKFTALTTKDGLLANTINTVVKDKDGFLWVGTNKGLNRYDGREFKTYTLKLSGEKFWSAEINVLHEDHNGRLWVCTMDGRLYLYDRQNDAFVYFINTRLHGQPYHPQINSICSDASGKLWLGTVNGLEIIDPQKRTITPLQSDSNHAGDLPTKIITYVFCDRSNQLWVGTFAGLYKYDRLSHQFTAFRRKINSTDGLASDSINTISQDQSGSIWVGTLNGLSKLMPDGKSFFTYRYQEQDNNSLCGNIVYCITPADKNSIWVGTEGGLNVINTASGNVTRYQHDPRNSLSINNKSVRCVFIDADGICWIGSYLGGLNKCDKNLTLFDVIHPSELDPHGLNAPFVSSFAVAKNGKIYVGTDGGGLNLFDQQTKRFDHIPIQSRIKTVSGGLPILNMLMDSKQQLWVGTYQHGLFKFNDAGTGYVQYTQGNGDFNISQNNVFSLKEDHAGNVWIGTNGAGVNIYSPATHTFTKLRPWYAAGDKRRLPLNGYIRAIEESNDGSIWIGSAGTGIAIYHPQTQTFDVLNPANCGLPIQSITELYKDNKGTIWIGTSGEGLYYYNAHTKRVVAFKNNAKLPDKVICKILQDKAGNMWFSTNKGICRLNSKNGDLTCYSQYNGLQSDVFINGSGFQSPDGTIFFGGTDGFNYFHINDVKTNRRRPPVVLTALNINNTRIAGKPESLVLQNISHAQKVTIRYKQDFSIHYIALNFTLPQQNRYCYILRGFTKSWSFVGNSTVASYTNLDPGEYTFEVKAANNDGQWNNTGASITIIVTPPFWMTWYAYMAYILAALATLGLIRRRGIRKIKKEMEVQQIRKDAETRHELDNLKIKFLTNISHEFRTPISLILAPADKLLAQHNDPKVTEQATVIKRNGRRLLNLVNQLLDFKKLEEHELQLNLTEGEFVSFVYDVADSFRDLAGGKKIKYQIVCPDKKVFVRYDADKIERILFNLLSNAFKFTPAGGSVKVLLTDLAFDREAGIHRLRLQVSDTGIGLSENDKLHVFDRFYQAGGPAAIINQGSGIGLSITKDLILLHGGKIELESESGKGAVFSVMLNLTAIDTVDEEHWVSVNRQPVVAPNKLLVGPVGLQTSTDLPHVLIVEDNDELRYYLAENLRPQYQVLEAVDGRDAWNKILSGHPDIVISDITMPFMDGISLSKKLKADKRTSHIPIILLTALNDQEHQVTGLESGATDYLTKPFNFEILSIKIKNLLALNRRFKETYQKQIKVSPTEKEFESGSEKFINNLVVYIEQNLTNSNFSVGDLSEHFGMSRGSLYSKIMEITGKSPIDFIREIKLANAATLLEKSEMTISEVAYSSGFSTPHYFAKSFKTKYHVLPSEYRAKKMSGVSRQTHT